MASAVRFLIGRRIGSLTARTAASVRAVSTSSKLSVVSNTGALRVCSARRLFSSGASAGASGAFPAPSFSRKAVKLTAAERAHYLPSLKANGWSDAVTDRTSGKPRDAIRRAYRFRDFNTAFGFMTRAALLAETVCTDTTATHDTP